MTETMETRTGARIEALDLDAMAAALDRDGWAVLPRLLTDAECDDIAALYAGEAGFRSRVVMARHGFGRGEYRYFSYPLPPLVARGQAPLQSDVPDSLAPFQLEDASLQPLAGFSVDARVLSRDDYGFGREADYSPTDLALGWGRMTDDAVLSKLDIGQSSRWYHYRWQGDPPTQFDPPRSTLRTRRRRRSTL